jgi:hypothetical protein
VGSSFSVERPASLTVLAAIHPPQDSRMSPLSLSGSRPTH